MSQTHVFKYLLVGLAVLLWDRYCWNCSFVFAVAWKLLLTQHVSPSTCCTSFLHKAKEAVAVGLCGSIP